MSAADVAYQLVKVYAAAVAVLGLGIAMLFVEPFVESTPATAPIWMVVFTFGVMIVLSLVTLLPRR